jgi:hypothetical protein
MDDRADWSTATWEGNRRRQHQDFLALPFREKLERIERLGEVAALFSKRRRSRGLRVRERPESGRGGVPRD